MSMDDSALIADWHRLHDDTVATREFVRTLGFDVEPDCEGWIAGVFNGVKVRIVPQFPDSLTNSLWCLDGLIHVPTAMTPRTCGEVLMFLRLLEKRGGGR